jgi:histone H2B
LCSEKEDCKAMTTPRRSPRLEAREPSPSPSPERELAVEAEAKPKRTRGRKAKGEVEAKAGAKAKGGAAAKAKAKAAAAKKARLEEKEAEAKAKGVKVVYRKIKRRRFPHYGSYIYRVLKDEMPDNSISRRAMSVLNSFVNDLFERLAQESIRMAKVAKRQTISSREVQSAVGVVFPGELAKLSKTEITKAVTKYNSGEGGTKTKKTPRKKRSTKNAAE